MNRQALKHILQSNYDRDQWISTLQFLTGKREYLTVHLSPKTIEINTQEADRIVKTFYQIGSLKTSDGISLPIFEIILEDNIRIEYNKVGVNDFIKKYIIKDAVKGALTTFSYDKDHEKKEWRFSFISKNSANDFFAEAEAEETNPKKYTYIFGTEEEHRTAIERLYNLEQSRFRLEDFFEAFNVEPVSKKFFEEYKNLYKQFSGFLADEKNEYRNIFEAEINDFSNKTKSDVEKEIDKDIRNFVSRLMGRMVFLYFLQKKHWLGASTTDYNDGSSTFLSDLFYNDVESQRDFYKNYLSEIFFGALNNPKSEIDKFKLHNGDEVFIPFLNGGLFEEEQEPIRHREIQFPAFYFEDLFKFFNGYNFTIYENSPEEHTVAVDPEMLGHIFENLIDYNKDTGTFYTPKEIVQYMTQESLVEYLNTHLQKERKELENLVKNHHIIPFNIAELEKIDQLLNDVKICDPAIGSGAFPMGMLQEIFNLKAVIAYELKKEWNPAQVKQNIIQSSIYGVDLDEGAVEIARLRFWLSLVVDEGKPKALPNLDYKIMQGNSVVESFKGIDLSKISTGNDLMIVEKMQKNLFGDLVDDQMKITISKSGLAEEIQNLIKKYFTAQTEQKKELKDKIQYKITEHIDFNIELRENQLHRQINILEQSYNNLKTKELKALENYKNDLQNLYETKEELYNIQKREGKPYFLWHLFFADVLCKGGFDIVIGNPPYVDIKSLDNDFVKYLFQNYETTINRINLYSIFIEKGKLLLNSKGVLSYIIPNSLLVNDSYAKIREHIIDELIQVIKLPDSIFEKAIVETIIILLSKKNNNELIDAIYYKNDAKTDLSKIHFNKHSRKEWKIDNLVRFNIFSNTTESQILSKIEKNTTILSEVTEFSLGITPYDRIKGHTQDQIKNRVFHSEKKISNEYVPLISGKNIKKYHIIGKVNEYLKYGEWLGAPRNPKFFRNPKIIVRQILDGSNLSIIAGYSEDEIYFTQIGFSIISKDDTEIKLKYILSLLNSKTLSFYHKYKFLDIEKNVFPKILIANCKKFPVAINLNANIILPQLVNFISYIYYVDYKIVEIIDNIHIANFFEEVVDAIVFEIYFPEEMQEKNITVITQIEEILQKHQADNFEHLNDDEKRKLIATLYYVLKESEVQQKMKQFVTASPDVLKVILQS